MLPSSSSSSHLASSRPFGQHLHHYKKFWLMHSQLENQDPTSTISFTLGVHNNLTTAINQSSVTKDSKLPAASAVLISGDHHCTISNAVSSGSCRSAESCSTSNPASSRLHPLFNYSPSCNLNLISEPACMSYSTTTSSDLVYPIDSGSNLNIEEQRPALSLAVHCDDPDQPAHAGNQLLLHDTIRYNWASAVLINQTCSLKTPTTPASSGINAHLQLQYHPYNIFAAQPVTLPSPVQDRKGESSDQSSTLEEIKGGSEYNYAAPSHSGQLFGQNMRPNHAECDQQGIVNNLSSNDTCNLNISSNDDLPCFAIAPVHKTSVACSQERKPSSSCAGTVIRTCTLCGTTKTPLWRSGSAGPKTLCNACGIRVKKSQRAEASEAAVTSHHAKSFKRVLSASSKSAGRRVLERNLSMEDTKISIEALHYKSTGNKRGYGRSCSWPPPKVVKVCSENGNCGQRYFRGALHDSIISSSSAESYNDSKLGHNKKSAKDVEEAAVLLMALSCGLFLS